MTQPLALQLYSVREALGRDFNGVLKQIATLGYVGVETAGQYGGSPAHLNRLCTDLGLTICSAHLPLPLGEKKNEVLDTAAALGVKRIALGGTPRDLRTVDQVKLACASFNEASAIAQAHGLTLGLHNHWWEFEQVDDGRTVFQVMQEHLEAAVWFELDTYWVKTAGLDPSQLIASLGSRAPLLHLKDGPCVVGQPMTAVGEGTVDIPGVVQAGAATADWLIVELDECATDMLEAVQKSYHYLVGKGLARGHSH